MRNSPGRRPGLFAFPGESARRLPGLLPWPAAPPGSRGPAVTRQSAPRCATPAPPRPYHQMILISTPLERQEKISYGIVKPVTADSALTSLGLDIDPAVDASVSATLAVVEDALRSNVASADPLVAEAARHLM